MSQKIRIKLKSFDHTLVDKSAEKIVKTVKATGAVVSGPIPLPTHKRIFTVNRSTFVNKKSREQFELASYKRLIDIYNSNNKTVEALMKLELASGVEVEPHNSLTGKSKSAPEKFKTEKATVEQSTKTKQKTLPSVSAARVIPQGVKGRKPRWRE